MVIKVSSVPLYGSPTREEVAAIQEHMHDFMANLAKNPVKASKFLEDVGAVAKSSEAAPTQKS